MKITYSPKGINNFHNATPINLCISGLTYIDYELHNAVEYYLISPRQRRRIEKHFCGVEGCACPSGGVTELFPGEYAIRKSYCK